MDSTLRRKERQWMVEPSRENLDRWNEERIRAGLEPIIEEVIAGLSSVGPLPTEAEPSRTHLFTIGPFWYVSWYENGTAHRSPATDEASARTTFSLIKDVLGLRCSACDNRGELMHSYEGAWSLVLVHNVQISDK